jgi:hypothetical protein
MAAVVPSCEAGREEVTTVESAAAVLVQQSAMRGRVSSEECAGNALGRTTD